MLPSQFAAGGSALTVTSKPVRPATAAAAAPARVGAMSCSEPAGQKEPMRHPGMVIELPPRGRRDGSGECGETAPATALAAELQLPRQAVDPAGDMPRRLPRKEEADCPEPFPPPASANGERGCRMKEFKGARGLWRQSASGSPEVRIERGILG